MADAFRGLTLRLGADSRPLESAISSITRSAAQAQTQMNRLSKALKLDPTNVNLMQSKIDLLGDKATHSARAFTKIREAMRQTSSESGDLLRKVGMTGSEFKELANSTTKAYAATQKVRDELYTVDSSLAHIYEAAAKVAQQTEKWSENDSLEWIKMLKEAMRGTGEQAEYAKNQLREYISKADSLPGVKEKFLSVKNGAAKLVEVYDELIHHHNKLESEQTLMNGVEGFRAMRLQAQAYKAELRGTVSETVRLKSELYAMGKGGRLTRAISDVKLLDAATENSVASAHKMIEAYKAFPTSLDAAVSKINAVKAAEATLKEKTDAIKAAMAKIRQDPAFDKVAASSEKAYIKAVKIEQEYTDIATKLKVVEELSEGFRKQLRNLDDNKVAKTSAEYKKVAENLQKCESRATALKAKLASIDDDHATASLITQMHRLEDQLAQARTQAAALHAQVSKLRAIGSLGKGFREFGFGMYASLTPAIMMAGRYAIQAVNDMDAAYRNMRKTVNGTDDDFEQLKADAIEFSRTHITSAEQMLEIEAIGGQLGIAVEELGQFAHTVSNLDIATNMDAEDIATSLGKMASVIGINAEEYDNFGDALVRLGNNMPVMESDIMNLTARYMGMGKVVGMTAPEMLAWSAAASATGQKAEAAGSSMQRFISNMETAVNSGGDSLQAWADVAGVSASKFSQAFRESASGAMYMFIEGLARIQNEGGSVNQTLKQLGINNVRDKQLLEGLAIQMANTGSEASLLANALQLSNEAYEGMPSDYNGKVIAAGDAMREAERKSEGFSGELGKLKNNAIALAEEFGKASVPMLQDLGSMFKDVSQAISGMNDDQKQFAVSVGVALAAVGPFTVGLGTMLQSVERIGGALKGAQGIFTNWAAKLNMMDVSSTRAMNANLKLQKALNFVGSTKGMVGLAAAGIAIGVIADAIGKAIQKAEDFKKATEGVGDALGKLDAPDLESALGTSARAFGLYNSELDAAIDKHARLASEISETYEKTNADAALAQHYADKINDLLDGYSGTAREQAELAAAVDEYNKVTGEAVEILDAQNGPLSVSTDELSRNAAAWIANAKSQAAANVYGEMLEANMKAKNAEEDALRARDEAHAKYVKAVEEHNSQLADLYAKEEQQAQEAYDEAHQLREKSDEDLARAEKQVYDYAEAAQAAKQTVDDFSDAVEAASDGQQSFAGMAMRCGVTQDELANKLAAAGVSAQKMASMGSESFANLYKAASGDCTLIARALDELDKKGVSPKDVKVSDNGTIEVVNGELKGLQVYTIGDKTFTVSVNDYASSVLRTIQTVMSNINNATVTARVQQNASGAIARGGVNSFSRGGVFRQSLARIPLNASGGINGIVTRPTLTNIGWVGEAGDEALFHMGHAGGAVIPLSNQRHVRPFARAVAAEMGGGSRPNVTVNMNLNYQAGDDAQAMLRAIERGLENHLNLEA